MFYFLVALLFFFLSIVIHGLICRATKKHGLLLKPLIVIGMINGVMCWGIFYIVSRIDLTSTQLLYFPLQSSALLFYFLLIPTYLVFYFSTQQVSPSKRIMLLLNQYGNLTRGELLKFFTNDELIQPRLDELLLTQCVIVKDSRYVLSKQGRILTQWYQWYQWILGRSKGG